MPILEQPTMNNTEARHAMARMGKWMKRGLVCASTAKQIYLEFDERRGWESYTNEEGSSIFGDCAVCVRQELRELGITRSRAHQLVAGAEVERDIGVTMVTPSGKTKDQIPQDDKGQPALCERLLRPLVPIKDPADRQKIMQRAIEAAGAGKISATFLAQAARAIVPTPEPKAEDKILKVMEDIQRIMGRCRSIGCVDALDALIDAYHTLGRFQPDEDQGN